MKVYETDGFLENDINTKAVYCGLDCCVTLAVYQEIEKRFESKHQNAYDISRKSQGPALDMMLRGIKVDLQERKTLVDALEKEVRNLQIVINLCSLELTGKKLNVQSPVQLKQFFFGEKGCRLTPWQKTQQVDQANLKKIAHSYAVPGIVAELILKLKDSMKLLTVLESPISEDGRCRTFFDISGTKTGRWAARKDAFWQGMNLQNLTDRVRKVFISDENLTLGYADLDGAESWAVAAYGAKILGITGPYWHACVKGDVHTEVAKKIWKTLGWQERPKEDRKLADTCPAASSLSYRDLAKRGGHATNYRGSPFMLMKVLKISLQEALEFQKCYFEEFYDIKAFHDFVLSAISDGGGYSLMGRWRDLPGSQDNPKYLREATAHFPQSFIADLLNTVLFRLWKASKDFPVEWKFSLLMQLHDAILFQYDKNYTNFIISALETAFNVETEITSKITLKIPFSLQTGKNWGKFHNIRNLEGLK